MKDTLGYKNFCSYCQGSREVGSIDEDSCSVDILT